MNIIHVKNTLTSGEVLIWLIDHATKSFPDRCFPGSEIISHSICRIKENGEYERFKISMINRHVRYVDDILIDVNFKTFPVLNLDEYVKIHGKMDFSEISK